MLSNSESVETKLQRIAEKARKEPDCQFTSLFHLMDIELLRGCFEGLRKDAASGIDRVTKEEYGKDLEANLSRLVERLHRMSYIPQPVLRVYIPKPGSTKQRPLGIPVLEDKLVQSGLVRILEAIYEGDFIEDSYGFRPARSTAASSASGSKSVPASSPASSRRRSSAARTSAETILLSATLPSRSATGAPCQSRARAVTAGRRYSLA